MAGENPVKSLCEETACPLCLDFFTDPVITDCGHNFCQACLTQCWGASQEEGSCPQCRETIQQSNFRPNRQLANVAELVKKLQEEKEREGAREEKRGACKIHQEPLKLFCREDETPICVVCNTAKEHQGHTVFPLEEAFLQYKVGHPTQVTGKEKTKIHLDTLKKKREELKGQKNSEELKRQKYQVGAW
ncbi:zinc finger protein RFP-like [Sceloporus undulatus]|uniref:zinc finger protein RFP-like n=1 Tax=Sceloporus undulatus TaxID=8520 RepID=UPI001C4B627D|nr:zinc finger protein RFP-like [Sceloporus undulatus]